MSAIVTKETLINEAMVLKSGNSKKAEKFIMKLEKFLTEEPDDELKLILYTWRTVVVDDNLQGFKKCCEIASPIFDILQSTVDWGYVEFYTLSAAIGYNTDFKKTLEFFEEALEVLSYEEYVNDTGYRSIRIALHCNLCLRILRAKYYDPNSDIAHLQKLFKQSYDYVVERSRHKNLPYKDMLEVYRAVFENTLEGVEEGLDTLSELIDRKWYNIAKHNIMDLVALMDGEMSKPLARLLIGHQMRKRRIELGLSISDLAEILGWENVAVGAIERAADGISMQRLRKVAQALGVTLEYFCGDESQVYEDDPFITAVRAYTRGASDADKEFILSHTKLYMGIKG